MIKKNFLSAKKIFLIIIFFFWIIFNYQNIYAESNEKLEKELEKIETEIKNLKSSKNFCKKTKSETEEEKKTKEEKNSFENLPEKTIKDFNDIVLNPENHWVYEEWIKLRNKFLEDIWVWWFQQIVDSFTIQFSWNYCFQKDLQKIDKLLYSSIDFWAKLAEKCNTWSILKIKKIIWENDKETWKLLWWKWSIKFLKEEFEKIWWEYHDPELYWYTDQEIENIKKVYKKNKVKFKSSDFYAKSCKEDSFTDAIKKIEEFKKKVWDLIKWDWDFFDNFSFNISEKELKKIEEWQKKIAEKYVTSNLNDTLWWFWIKAIIDEKWKWENIFETIVKTSKNITNWLKSANNEKDENNKVKIEWNIKNLLNKSQEKISNSEYADTATSFFEKNSLLNSLEEDWTNQIVFNIKLLENDIVKANWHKKELKDFGEKSPENKDLKTFKNFILKFWKFLDKHNTKAWTVEKVWLNCDKKTDDFYKNKSK